MADHEAPQNSKPKNTKLKVPVYIFVTVAILFAAHFYMEWHYIGFPDGHKTELDLVMEKLYPTYIILIGIFIIYSLYLIWGKSGNQKRIKLTFILFPVFMVMVFLINHYLATHLEHGAGG